MKKLLGHWQKPKRLRFSRAPNQNIFPTPVFSHQFSISFFITNHWDFKKEKKKKKSPNTDTSLSLWLTFTACDQATAATVWTTLTSLYATHPQGTHHCSLSISPFGSLPSKALFFSVFVLGIWHRYQLCGFI